MVRVSLFIEARQLLIYFIIEIRFDWHFKTRQDVNTVNVVFRVVFSLWVSAARSKV